MQLISKQQTGKKMIRDLQNMKICAVFVHAQLPIWYMLIRQVAALWHVKNYNIDYTLVFANYLWLCNRWNFCNCENIPQSTMCYFFWDTVYITTAVVSVIAKMIHCSLSVSSQFLTVVLFYRLSRVHRILLSSIHSWMPVRYGILQVKCLVVYQCSQLQFD